MLINRNFNYLLRLKSTVKVVSGVRCESSKSPPAKQEQFDNLSMALIFKLFAPDRSGPPMLHRLDLAKLTGQRWREWKERQVKEIELSRQRFFPERVAALGNDLAAAYFVIFRGGKVRFHGQDKWISKEAKSPVCEDLPSRYIRGLFLEGIDMSGTNLMIEGLENLVNLSKLKTLILRDCKHADDWFVDRISGQFRHLEYLDLSDCPKVTENAMSCLYRLDNLKTLVLRNTVNSKEFELACLLLEEAIPNLVIEGVTYIECKVEE